MPRRDRQDRFVKLRFNLGHFLSHFARVFLIRAEQPMESARGLWEDIHDVAHVRDRFADEGMAAKDMEATMNDAFRRLASIALTGGTRTIDSETAEALRKLGYFGGK